MMRFYSLLCALLCTVILNAQTIGVKEAEPNNTPATAQAITTNPAKISGNVFPNADVDVYSFSATAGDKVYAATMTAFSSNSSFDSQLRLFASDGTTLIEFDDDDGSLGSLSSTIAGATIPTTGTYYLEVRHFSTTNQLRGYDLYVKVQSGSPTPEVEGNDTPATANVMPASGWVSGARNPAAATEQDWFSVTLAAGESVFISMDLDPERDNVQYDGRLGFALFGDADNQILVVNDASTGSATNPLSEAFFFTAKNAGTYYVFADAVSAATGGPTATYTISYSKFSAETGYVNTPSVDVPKVIGPTNVSVTSTLTVPGSPRIGDISVRLTLNHALMADIDAVLTSPGGNTIHLFTDIGAAATGGQTQMDLFLNDNNGIPPTFTVLRPIGMQPEVVGKLNQFKGMNAGGVWTLTLYDDVNNASGGTLTGWSLDIKEDTGPNLVGATTIFSTDFETGAAGFTHSGTADEWELGTPATIATTTTSPVAGFTTANSGTQCWKTDLDNTYNVSSNQSLLSPNIAIPAGSNPVWIKWAMKYQMESTNFDQLRVYVQQVGNPASAKTLFDWLGATQTATVGNPTVNVPQSAGWATHFADISSFAGQNIEFIVQLVSDNTVNFGGVAIDDVAVYQLCTPSSITLGANPAVCAGTTTTGLSYTATTGAPDQYSIDYDAAAEAAGFVDVTNAALAGSPITLTVPGAAAAATYNATITVIKAVGGCVSPAVPFTVTVNAAPALFTVTDGGTYCGGAGVPVGLSGSESGVNYQLFNGASPAGAAVPGTGGAISFGAQTAVGTYTVVATNSATLCTANMTGTAVVATATAPVVNAPTVTQPTIATPTGTIVVNATGGPTLEYRLNGGSYQLSNTFAGLTPGGSYNIFVRIAGTSGCEVAYSSNPVVLNSVSVRVTDVLVGASPFQDSLWTINLADYTIIRRLGPTMASFTITGINGIATNPLTGEHYAIIKVSAGGRRLAKINVQTGVATLIGNLNDNFSTLAFRTDGQLFGVTGNGATVPETMYTIDTLSGATTLYRTLGNGADGEVIAYNPDDNFFYHWSGNGTVVWEKFANNADPIQPLTTPINGEVFGALYAGGGKFFVSNISSEIRQWDIPTQTTTPSLMSTPDDLRGLVRESCVSSLAAGGPTTICSGGNVVLSVIGGTGNYQWYQNGVLIPGETNVNYTATAAGTYNCIYTDGCGVTDSVSLGLNVLVNPTPDATATPAAQTICTGNAIDPIVLTGTLGGTTFTWTRDNTATVTGIAASGSGDISGTLTNSSTAPITVTFTITPTAGGCSGTPVTATVTVNPNPTVDPVANQVVCNTDATTAVTFTSPIAGTVFSWTNNTPSIGLGASGTGNIASFIATNATNAPVTATITVTPSTTTSGGGGPVTVPFAFTGGMQTWTVPAGVTSISIEANGAQGGSGATGGGGSTGGQGGLGARATGTLAVTPGQVLNIFVGGQGGTPTAGFNGGGNGGTQNSGGGGGASDVRAGGTAPADRVITAGGGGGGGRGGCHEGALIGGTAGNGGVGGGGIGQNGNDSPQSSGFAGGGFGGNAGSIQGAAGAAGIGCSGFLGQPGVATTTEVGGVGGGGQSCCCSTSNSVPGGGGGGGGQIGGGGGGGGSAGTTGCSGNSKGAGAGGGGGSSYIGGVTSGALINGVNAGNGSITISYTAAAPVTCTGTPTTFTYTVNPTATVNAVSNQSVCNGASTTAVNFTSPTTGGTIVYNWTNNTPSIGLAGSGTGNIAAFTATNTGTAPVTATITVTPTYTNGVSCTGTPITFTITVNPTATVNAVSNQTVCNGASTTAVAFSSPTTGGTIVYNWTNNTPSIGLAGSGTGNIAAFTATNTGTAPVTATITVTPTYTNGVSCTGTPRTFTITVNPTATVTAVANQTVCNGASTTAVNFSSPTTGGTIVYNWTNNTPSIGLAGSGTGNIASFTATNTGATPVVATITVTPTYTNGVSCVGTPRTFTITVNPTPIAVATPATQTICSGAAIAPIVLTSTTPGTTFAWTRNNTAAVTGIAASGSGNITGTLVNTTTTAQTVTFTITPTANGCVGAPITATVIVQAPLTIVCPGNITVNSTVGLCTAPVTYSTTVTGTPAPTLTYSTTGATVASGSGNGSGLVFNLGVTTVTVTATNICTTVSCSFTVTVLDSQLPVVTSQPANRTVCTGTNATFSVTAATAPSAGGPIAYQWQQWNGSAWVNIAGATASSYTVTGTTVSMNTNSFRVVLTGLCSVVNSNPATLYVNPLPTIALTASPTVSLLPNQTTTITATTNPSGGTFVWSLNGNPISGVTGPVLGPITVDEIGTYRAVYTDRNGCVITSSTIDISGMPGENLWVYPNPNQGQFQVRYYNQVNENLTLNIYNALGQRIFNKGFATTTAYTSIPIDLGDRFSEGVYIVEVINAAGKKVGAKRVIVRHP